MNILLKVAIGLVILGALTMGKAFSQAKGTSRRWKIANPVEVSVIGVWLILFGIIFAILGLVIQAFH